MKLAALLVPGLAAVALVGVRTLSAGCGGSGQTLAFGGDGGGSGSSSGGDGSASSGSSGSGGSSGSAGSSGSSSGAGSSSGGQPPGALPCSTPSTSYSMNGGSCGSYRWAVKTGTDDDVTKVDMVPQVTTIPMLTTIATPTVSDCNRNAPTEQQVYELKDVELKFEREEADSDYHIVATDPATGQTMVTEVPYPGCVGQDPEHCGLQHGTPLECAISRARAAVDAKVPQGTQDMTIGTGTIVGPAFFDVYELMGTTHPTGMAPNGIEIHPILAICFGQGCNPTAGY